MPHSQSNLTSLATLLQNAEARRSATPPPALLTNENDSGLIDIAAMQKRAAEERLSSESATKTPVPVVTAVRSATTDPDLFAASIGARRKKQLAIGAGIAGAALIALLIGLGSSHSPRAHDAAAAAHVVEPPVTAAPPPPVAPAPPSPPAPPVVAAAPAPEPPAPAADTVATKGKGKKHKGHPAKAKGPKLTKVTSGGT